MSKLTKYSELKHGMRVKCKIEGTQIDDARLSIDKNGEIFICQNLKNRFACKNKLGYKYSYCLAQKNENIEDWCAGVKDLESVEEAETVENKKIKSITVGLPVDKISFQEFTISKIKELSQEQLESLKILANECGKIEYEKPTILKRRDGSVISGLEEGQEVVVIKNDGVQYYLAKNYYSYLNNIDKKQGLIFLPEDTHLAEKKREMLTKRDEIQFEIDKLNAEEGGITTDDDYYHLDFDANNCVDKWDKSERHSHTHCSIMSKKTAETILKKYSQDELKQYLGIII